MNISFSCPNCRKVFSADESYAGEKATCDQCGSEFIVPATDNEPAQFEKLFEMLSEKQKETNVLLKECRAELMKIRKNSRKTAIGANVLPKLVLICVVFSVIISTALILFGIFFGPIAPAALSLLIANVLLLLLVVGARQKAEAYVDDETQ